MDVGLEAAGFDLVACVERDADCVRSVRVNRPQWRHLDPGEVVAASKKYTPTQLGLRRGELTLLAGGPPCQPFSTASQWSTTGRRGMDDDRAGAVAGMLNFAESFLPEIILFENVVGFFQGNRSATQYVQARLDDINQKNGTKYRLDYKIVNAADYGVPQNRRRAIGISSRSGADIGAPVPNFSSSPLTCWDALYDLDEISKPDNRGNWSGLLPSIPEGANYQHLTSQGQGEEVFGYRTRYWSFLLKLAKDRPSWTLAASPGPSTGPFHWENRPLSVREMMRIQSFPDDWKIIGTERVKIRQIGNATPPLLAEVFGRHILADLFSYSFDYPLHHLRSRASTPPPKSEAPQSVPRIFKDLIGQKPAHPGTGKGPGRVLQ